MLNEREMLEAGIKCNCFSPLLLPSKTRFELVEPLFEKREEMLSQERRYCCLPCMLGYSKPGSWNSELFKNNIIISPYDVKILSLKTSNPAYKMLTTNDLRLHLRKEMIYQLDNPYYKIFLEKYIQADENKALNECTNQDDVDKVMAEYRRQRTEIYLIEK